MHDEDEEQYWLGLLGDLKQEDKSTVSSQDTITKGATENEFAIGKEYTTGNNPDDIDLENENNYYYQYYRHYLASDNEKNVVTSSLTTSFVHPPIIENYKFDVGTIYDKIDRGFNSI